MRRIVDGVRALAGLTGALSGVLLSGVSFAHEDEPFELDRQPPFVGPAFRGGSLDSAAAAERGAIITNFQSRNIQLLSWLPLNQFDPTLSSGATVEGFVSPSGREYALFGHSGGSSYVEVTDPDEAQILATIPGPISLWRDIAIYQNYAYVVSEGGQGVQIINLSQIDSGVVTQVGSINSPNTQRTHTVHINRESGFLYRCGGGNWQPTGRAGLRIYSLADPANPVFVGQWTTRYVHECQVVNWTSGALAGRELAFVYSEDTSGGTNPRMEILDVTDKSNITLVGTGSWANAVYSHQGWLSQDRQFVFINDELDELNAEQPTLTRVFNVSNPAVPIFVGGFGNGLNSIDHNLYTRGTQVLQSNYRTGLRVWEAPNPALSTPFEAAWFDTYPESDSQNFNGLWDNDPYLPSGIVLGSDIERGLFIWWVGPAPLRFGYPDGRPARLRPSGAMVRVTIDPVGTGVLDPGTARLYFNAGPGSDSVALEPIGGNVYEAALPPLACGARVEWYVTGESRGATYRDPPSGFGAAYVSAVQTIAQTGFNDEMESDLGWSAFTAGDTASTGRWVRTNPNGTAAQPEDDATPGAGVTCWVTGNAPAGQSASVQDVDNGITTLTSPMFTAVGTPGEAYLAYSRWYSNNEAGGTPDDDFTVQISNNNGASWSTLEIVSQTETRWVPTLHRIASVIAPTAQMRLRFIARDVNGASTVEAGVDDVQVQFMRCSTLAGDTNGNCIVGLDDLAEISIRWGQATTPGGLGDPAGDGAVNLLDIALVINNWGAACAE